MESVAATPAQPSDRPNPRRRIETTGPGLLGFNQRQEAVKTTPATIPRVNTAALRAQLQRMEGRELAHANEIKNAKAAAKANELRATTAEAVAQVAEANFQRLVTREKRREDAARAAAALPAIPTTRPPSVYQPDVVDISPAQGTGSDGDDDQLQDQDEFDFMGGSPAHHYDGRIDQALADQQAAQVQQTMAASPAKRPAPLAIYYQGQVRNPSSYLNAHWSTHRPEDVKTDSARAITDLDRHVVTGDRKIIKRMMVLAHESRCSIIRAGIKINSTLDTRTHARSVSDLMGDLEKPVMGKFLNFLIN